MNRVGFGELSTALKVLVVLGWIYSGLFFLAFLGGFVGLV